MAQMQDRKSQSHKTDDARDLQAKLYREIGISAVAAALQFTTRRDGSASPACSHPIPGVLRGDDLAA